MWSLLPAGQAASSRLSSQAANSRLSGIFEGSDKALLTRINRKTLRTKKHQRVRNRIKGTADRPRLSVYRSLSHIYAQVIDDQKGITLAAASSVEKGLRDTLSTGGDLKAAKEVGRLIGAKAMSKGITKVVFDRGGNIYHGRIAAVAEGARESGLEF
jgi:large subunit ribosomal protein L18